MFEQLYSDLGNKIVSHQIGNQFPKCLHYYWISVIYIVTLYFHVQTITDLYTMPLTMVYIHLMFNTILGRNWE